MCVGILYLSESVWFVTGVWSEWPPPCCEDVGSELCQVSGPIQSTQLWTAQSQVS